MAKASLFTPEYQQTKPLTALIPRSSIHLPLLLSLLGLSAFLAHADRVHFNDGRPPKEGKVVLDTPSVVELKWEKRPGIFQTDRFLKTNIERVEIDTKEDIQFRNMGQMLPTPDRLTPEDYQRRIVKCKAFLDLFPAGAHAPKVQLILKTLEEEYEKSVAGGLKLENKWIAPYERKRDGYAIDAGLAYADMLAAKESSNLTMALRYFETIQSDFAGSTLVHSVGGWGALITIYLLGARIGKFDQDGKPKALPGHSLPIASAGVFILWLGWFGFNGGSVLSADPELTSLTLVTTSLAAAAGGVAATFFSNLLYKNFDLTMFMNGVLGGLVGITAGADQMMPTDAILIGLIAGVVVVLGISFIDKLKLDDPVGAVAVHLICGIWGTLAVGIFGAMAGVDQFLVQLIGVGIVGAFCVTSSFIILFIVKASTGLRVNKDCLLYTSPSPRDS